MQNFIIPQWVADSVIARKGRLHMFDDLDPQRTALVVVDMQNGFMLPGVAHSLCVQAQDIVPNVNRLAQTVRDTGGTVVWIQGGYTDKSLTSWSTYWDTVVPARREKRIASLTPGNKGFDLYDGLDARPQDLRVMKERFSAFIQGSSNLEAVLRERGLDTLLITGTTTDVCCESTARDAMMLNFRTIMVSDGTAAMRDELHAGALISFYLNFGDVMTTDFAVDCLRANANTALRPTGS